MNGTARAHPPDGGIPALKPQLVPGSGKIDIEALATSFRARLAPHEWAIYRSALSQFLVGKLTRAELVRCLREQLRFDSAELRGHNMLVLALLANAVRAPTATSGHRALPGADSGASRPAMVRGHADLRESREQRLFRDVLALPARERRRIKAIAKEAPQNGVAPLIPPPPPVLLAARHAMLPHLPYLPDTRARTAPKGINARIVFDKAAQAAAQASAASAKFGGAKPAVPNAGMPATALNSAPAPAKETPLPLSEFMLNLAPARASGPLTWTQDVIQALDAPLIAEAREFPEDSVLGTRMLGVALEHGLLQGIGAGTTDIMLLGLESYLRSIVGQLTSQCHRRTSSQNPLTAEDLDMLLRAQPSELGEHMAPAMRLRTQYLQDEPSVEPRAAAEDEPVRKRESPWDLGRAKRRRESRPEHVEKLLNEHENGRALASSLLN